MNEQIELTQDQIKQFTDAFNAFDDDNDGKISAEQVAMAIRSVGHIPSEAHLYCMIRDANVDYQGLVQLPAFLKMMLSQVRLGDVEQRINDAFSLFDTNGTGTISITKFSHIMKNLGEPLTQDEIDDIVSRAGRQVDGVIDYRAFVTQMISA